MRRYYLLKGCALAAGVGLFVLGLVGMSPLPPSPPLPENLLHFGTGLLYFGASLLLDSPNLLRTFVWGMGLLLMLSKLIIVRERLASQGLQIPSVGVVCFVVGVSSLLIASFRGIRTPLED